MKSVISALSLAGLAAAIVPQCSMSYVTKTETELFTVTVYPQSTVYPQPTGAAQGEDTVTSTTEITTTITVTASPSPKYPINNGTSTAPAGTGTGTGLPGTGTAALPITAYPEFSAIAPEDVYEYSTTVALSAYPEFSAIAPSDIAQPAPTAAPHKRNAGFTSANKGEATFFYGTPAVGACADRLGPGFTLPAGVYGAAHSYPDWANGANCGKCIMITGPEGNQIKAQIVDLCPTARCQDSHIDLYPEGFQLLAPLDAGHCEISWNYVPC